MNDSTHNPPNPPLLRRIMFWVAVIHFIAFGLMVAANWASESRISTLATFPLQTVGFFRAAALWLFLNDLWIWLALTVGNAVALALLWRQAYGLNAGRALLIYLSAVGLIVACHVAAMAYLARLGHVRTPQTTYVFTMEDFASFAIMDVWLSIPASLLLLGRIIRPAQPLPGFCRQCGYDLRASTDKCPECGSPIPARSHS